MSFGITGSNMQSTASALLYGTVAAVVGRKFCASGLYKVSAKAAELIGSKHAAEEWNKSGDAYLVKAKKEFVRDVVDVTGFLVAVGLVSYLGDAIKAEALEEAKANQSWREWLTSKPTQTLSHVMLSLAIAIGVYVRRKRSSMNYERSSNYRSW